MTDLNTENLDQDQILEFMSKIERYTHEIKNEVHKGELFEIKFYNEKGEKIIDFDSFIDYSITDALTDYNKKKYVFYNPKSFVRKTLKSRSIEYLIRRFKNDFTLSNSKPRKAVNEFFKFVKDTVYSAVHHFFRDVYSPSRDYKDFLKVDGTFFGTKFQTPERVKMKMDNLNTIHDCFDYLPEKQKTALAESTFTDKTQQEIAQKMENSQVAVSKLIKKARDNLMDKLIENGIFEAKKFENKVS